MSHADNQIQALLWSLSDICISNHELQEQMARMDDSARSQLGKQLNIDQYNRLRQACFSPAILVSFIQQPILGVDADNAFLPADDVLWYIEQNYPWQAVARHFCKTYLYTADQRLLSYLEDKECFIFEAWLKLYDDGYNEVSMLNCVDVSWAQRYMNYVEQWSRALTMLPRFTYCIAHAVSRPSQHRWLYTLLRNNIIPNVLFATQILNRGLNDDVVCELFDVADSFSDDEKDAFTRMVTKYKDCLNQIGCWNQLVTLFDDCQERIFVADFTPDTPKPFYLVEHLNPGSKRVGRFSLSSQEEIDISSYLDS